MIDLAYTSLYQQLFKDQIANLGQDNWLRAKRQTGIDRFLTAGFPTIREEAWKYTNVKALSLHPFHWHSANQKEMDTSLVLDSELDPSLCRLVFINGMFSKTHSHLKNLPDGVEVFDLAHLLEKDVARIKPYLETDDAGDAGSLAGFAALNTAFLQHGAVIFVKPNTIIQTPLHISFIHTAESENAFSNLRNLFILGKNSHAVIIEDYLGHTEQRVFHNIKSSSHLAEGAQLTHYKLQREGNLTYHIALHHAQLEKNAHFKQLQIALGAKLSRSDVQVNFNTAHASCELNGFYAANAKQHMDLHTRIDHQHPHCTSREYYKGVLDDHARVVFDGNIYVHPHANKSDANLQNKNLLLSNAAEIDTKPLLEIYNDDVKAAHGATVGRLDNDQLFYLRARGIPEEEARRLLIHAFAADVLKSVDDQTLHETFSGVISEKLTTVTHDFGH